MEFDVIRLENGLRIVHLEDRNVMTVHCGFTLDTGSRDEFEEENGLAHLIEHCMFKGTKRRKAFHILSRLDSVGGEINAYTTKEETAIYASALKAHFDRAAELLVDIVFSSVFPENEIEKEKSVIVDEINSYKDNPDEMLMDEFEEKLFPKHPLGRSILGTEQRLQRFKQEDILQFIERNYQTDQIVFTCVGNISRNQLDRFIEKTLSKIPARKSGRPERTHPDASVYELTRKRNVHQVHALLGSRTIGYDDHRIQSMAMLNNILGGPALNSRLNLNIRERFGYCYYIESNYTPYADCGVFQIYYATDIRHTDRVRKLVAQELNELLQNPLNERTLNGAKKQILGQLALAQENRVNLMLSLGKSMLKYDQVYSFQEVEQQVEEVNAAEIQDLAIESFHPSRLSFLNYIPDGRQESPIEEM